MGLKGKRPKTFYLLQNRQDSHRISNLEYLKCDPNVSVESLAAECPKHDWKLFTGVKASEISTEHTIWFRFDLLQAENSQAPWWMVIDWPLLEHLRVHVYDHSTRQWSHSKWVGARYPVEERVVNSRIFTFPLQLTRGNRSSVYIELNTNGNVVMPVTIWQRDAYVFHEQFNLVLLGLIVGCIVAMFLYNLSLSFLLRDKAYLYYTAYVASVAFYMICAMGLGDYFLWENSFWSGSRAYATSVGLSFFAAICFSREFLAIKKYGGWVLKIHNGTIVAWFSLTVMAIFADHDKVDFIVFPIIAFTLIGGIVMTLYLWRWRNQQAKYFTVAWTLLIVGTGVYSSMLNGLIEFSYTVYYVHLISFVAELTLLSYALASRINVEREQRIQAQEEVVRVQQEHNELLDQHVQERTRQLKETMAQLKEANQELMQLSVTDSMTKIYNRRYFDRTLAEECRRAHRNQHSIAVLLIDIDHFKQVNDTFGHAVGDQCLKLVAATLEQEVKRSGDLVARYGGEEFVCVLPDTGQGDAELFADQCRKTVSTLGFEYNGVKIPLTASVGVAACVPQAEDAYRGLVQAADNALYAAKKAGRNCVVTAPYDIQAGKAAQINSN